MVPVLSTTGEAADADPSSVDPFEEIGGTLRSGPEVSSSSESLDPSESLDSSKSLDPLPPPTTTLAMSLEMRCVIAYLKSSDSIFV